MTIATKMMTANIDMARAFSHPQLKKCFTNANQIINRIKEEKSQKKAPKKRKERNKAKNSAKKASKIAPTNVPTAIIATALENFAFSLPASALPASHRTGDRTMMFIIMCMTNVNKLRLKVEPHRLPYKFTYLLYCFWYFLEGY